VAVVEPGVALRARNGPGRATVTASIGFATT
jgi:hypothetical protein